MKVIYGSSKNGDASEALKNVKSSRGVCFLQLRVKICWRILLEKLRSGFLGCLLLEVLVRHILTSSFFDSGITVIAMSDHIKVVANVLEQASVMPMKIYQTS